jgi:hypothetical protein
MKVIVAGTRTVRDPAIVSAAIGASPFHITEIVEGDAPGVDRIAGFLANQWKVPCKRFPANWALYGDAAGPRRNQQMAEYAEGLIAVWDGVSRGTADMITRATVRKLPVFIYRI